MEINTNRDNQGKRFYCVFERNNRRRRNIEFKNDEAPLHQKAMSILSIIADNNLHNVIALSNALKNKIEMKQNIIKIETHRYGLLLKRN